MTSGPKPERAISKRVDIGGTHFNCPCHVCGLFDSDEAQYAVLLPFVQEGNAQGERSLQFVDKHEREARLRRITAYGIDVENAQRKGELEIAVWEDVYLRDAKFNATSMLEFVQECLENGRRRGFSRTRLWANMEWALSDLPGVDDLVRYESRLNYFLPLSGDAVVCAYDVNRFSASVLENVVAAHPHVFADGWGGLNPYYVPPDQLLPTLT